MACEQAVRRGGTFASVTDSMWLVLAFQGWYVADALYNEVRVICRLPYPLPSPLVARAEPLSYVTEDYRGLHNALPLFASLALSISSKF